MNKGYLPYLHNGKKFHILPDGQCLYRYPKGDGVETVKVSKELRRKLFEFDKHEYNDDHREYRRRGELPCYDDTDAWEYVADESTYTLEDCICERIDRENILKSYPEEYSVTVMKDVKPRKYEELRTLFNGIFKYAVASGIIQHNPVALIKFKRAERQSRESLSKGEILAFLERIKDAKYDNIRQFAYILYFFGLRPCEIDEETHREGDFLITRNRKRKNGKIEYKKIPIPTQAQELIDWDKPLTADLHRLKINDIMKELLADKTAYCLRHTFATVCQQYVRPDIVDIWMGDSPQRLVGKVYTHYPDDFMYEQMQMVKFPLPQTA